MRSKMLVDIQMSANGRFMSGKELVDHITDAGYGSEGSIDEDRDWEVRHRAYQKEAEEHFLELPELAQDEKMDVIFFHRVPEHGFLMVTRPNDMTAVFRIINPSLGDLQDATRTLIRKLHDLRAGMSVKDGRVDVYEKGSPRRIMRGTLIERPLRETLRRRRTDLVIFLVAIALAALTAAAIFSGWADYNIEVRGIMDRLLTGLMVTPIVPGVNLILTWFALRRLTDIDWSALKSDA